MTLKAIQSGFLIIVTGFGKTDHLCTFIVLRNVNLENSLSYDLAVVCSRSMGLALEIKHLQTSHHTNHKPQQKVKLT